MPPRQGLLRSDDEGNVHDFFFGRLMVPILDRRGRVAGFGGRSLDGSNPKYINTPATPIFDKQATLYALDKAASAIREQETAVIVEGYMDVIAAHQNDRKNVVASMGTALTERQVYLVRSLAKTVVLALDADIAGQEATLRSLEASWRAMERRRFGQREEVSLRIAVLPEGSDPDDIIRESTGQVGRDREVRRSVHGLRHSRHGATPRPKHASGGRAGRQRSSCQSSSRWATPSSRDRYFGQLADTLGVTREQLQASIGKLRPAPRERRPSGAQPSAPPSTTTVSPLASGDRDPLGRVRSGGTAPLAGTVIERRGRPLRPKNSAERRTVSYLLNCSLRGTIDELQRRIDESLLDHFTRLTESDLKPTTRQLAPRAIQQALERLEQPALERPAGGDIGVR